jgi:signal transduction histidine kinase
VKRGASFRWQLVSGSVLWTLGLLFAVSILSVHLLATNPSPHAAIRNWFARAHLGLALAGMAAMIGGAWQIRRTLKAMTLLHSRLGAVHSGADRQLSGRYPSEIQPLVDDLNVLLAEREQRVQRALAKAGDLAHGLKTPLAVLARDADRATALGDSELASSMTAQVERMRRQIDYHLAHARASAAGALPGTRSLVGPSVDALFRTLERLHAERSISLRSAVGPAHAVRCQREDLEEMLGNVLDNACKWARSRVEVDSEPVGTAIVVTVDDDGPGIDPGMAAEVLKRGVRADERVEGTGLGLAIVRDLAEIYDGSIELSRSPLGGLRARLQLPAAD